MHLKNLAECLVNMVLKMSWTSKMMKMDIVDI